MSKQCSTNLSFTLVYILYPPFLTPANPAHAAWVKHLTQADWAEDLPNPHIYLLRWWLLYGNIEAGNS